MVLERDRKLTIRIADDELAMLRALADADGVSGSDVVRTLIRREHIERFGAQKPKKR